MRKIEERRKKREERKEERRDCKQNVYRRNVVMRVDINHVFPPMTTPTGKRDKRALTALIAYSPSSETKAGGEGGKEGKERATGNDGDAEEESGVWDKVARAVRGVFGQRLGEGALDRSREFYALGGDSLALVQVVGELARSTGVRVRLGDCPRPGQLELGWFEAYIALGGYAENGGDADTDDDGGNGGFGGGGGNGAGRGGALGMASASSSLSSLSSPTDPTVQVCEFTPDHLDAVVRLFASSFVGGEPLMYALKVPNHIFRPFAEGFCGALAEASAAGPGKTLSFVGIKGGQVIA